MAGLAPHTRRPLTDVLDGGGGSRPRMTQPDVPYWKFRAGEAEPLEGTEVSTCQ